MEVTGPSMSPTLWGQHVNITCSGCAIQWNAHWQPALRPQNAIVCWNCGAKVVVDDLTSQPGNRVQLCPPVAASPVVGVKAGDLLAIDAPEPVGGASREASSLPPVPQIHYPRWSVKRLFAMPGESISLRQGLLVVEPNSGDSAGAALNRSTVWITVHDDRFRRHSHSWWRPAGSELSVTRSDNCFRLESSSSAAVGLVYHHFAVHNEMRPDVIRDDVAGNLNETRLLLPVERIRLSMTAEASLPSEIEVVMEIGDQTRWIRRSLPAGVTCAVFDSAAGELFSQRSSMTMPLPTATSPIAVRVSSGAIVLSNLIVERPLVYRIPPRHADRWQWPIKLGDDEYFVLGDNVPLSIDSRHWGPISGQRIVGRICPIGYDEQQR